MSLASSIALVRRSVRIVSTSFARVFSRAIRRYTLTSKQFFFPSFRSATVVVSLISFGSVPCYAIYIVLVSSRIVVIINLCFCPPSQFYRRRPAASVALIRRSIRIVSTSFISVFSRAISQYIATRVQSFFPSFYSATIVISLISFSSTPCLRQLLITRVSPIAIISLSTLRISFRILLGPSAFLLGSLRIVSLIYQVTTLQLTQILSCRATFSYSLQPYIYRRAIQAQPILLSSILYYRAIRARPISLYLILVRSALPTSRKNFSTSSVAFTLSIVYIYSSSVLQITSIYGSIYQLLSYLLYFIVSQIVRYSFAIVLVRFSRNRLQYTLPTRRISFYSSLLIRQSFSIVALVQFRVDSRLTCLTPTRSVLAYSDQSILIYQLSLKRRQYYSIPLYITYQSATSGYGAYSYPLRLIR